MSSLKTLRVILCNLNVLANLRDDVISLIYNHLPDVLILLETKTSDVNFIKSVLLSDNEEIIPPNPAL